MKIQDQVSSLELSKKLKELGVKQESLYYWCSPGIDWRTNGEWELYPAGYVSSASLISVEERGVSAFTVAELGEMLPSECKSYRPKQGEFKWECELYDISGKGYRSCSGGETEANARAKMLIYLIENNLTP